MLSLPVLLVETRWNWAPNWYCRGSPLGFCSKGSGAWRQGRVGKTWGFVLPTKIGGLMGSTQEKIATWPSEIQISSRKSQSGIWQTESRIPGFKNKQKTAHFELFSKWVHPQIQSLDHDETYWNSHGIGLQNTGVRASLNFFCCQYPWQPGPSGNWS